MNKYFIIFIIFIISCESIKINKEPLNMDNETRYYLMRSIEGKEEIRLLRQSSIKEIEDLEGTFWVKEIPETNIYSFNSCFAFFDNNILIIEVSTEDRIPELPITSVQRYRFYIYKIIRCVEYEIIDDKQIKALDGLISISLEDTFLYVHIMGFDIEKYHLHSTFDTPLYPLLSSNKHSDIVYSKEMNK